MFTSLKPGRPLIRALPVEKYLVVPDLEEIRARQLINIASVQEALEFVHKDDQGLVSKSQKGSIEAHNKRTNIKPVNFTVGDFVLLRTTRKRTHKLQFLWFGPRRIVEVK